MSQHDMNIADALFPDFRTDLNNALGALVTLSSGATAPSTTFANMLWYDTANNQIKLRNEADDAWIVIAELDQTNDAVSKLLDGNIILNSAGAIMFFAGTPFSTAGALNLNTGSAAASLNISMGGTTQSRTMATLTLSGFSNPVTADGMAYHKYDDQSGTNGSVAPNNSGGVAYNTTSDRKIKTRIRDLEEEVDPVELIRNIRVRKFELRQGGNEAIGVIHDELEVVYPQACSKTSEGLGQVDRSELAIPALAAAKKLAAMVETLEDRVTQLETELARRP